MGVRSLGNVLASYGYKFGTTGVEAVSPAPIPVNGLSASGGTGIGSAVNFIVNGDTDV